MIDGRPRCPNVGSSCARCGTPGLLRRLICPEGQPSLEVVRNVTRGRATPRPSPTRSRSSSRHVLRLVLSNPTTLSVLAVALCDDADQLSRVCFGNYFGLLADAVSNGVGDVDETIVDAIRVHVMPRRGPCDSREGSGSTINSKVLSHLGASGCVQHRPR